MSEHDENCLMEQYAHLIFRRHESPVPPCKHGDSPHLFEHQTMCVPSTKIGIVNVMMKWQVETLRCKIEVVCVKTTCHRVHRLRDWRGTYGPCVYPYGLQFKRMEKRFFNFWFLISFFFQICSDFLIYWNCFWNATCKIYIYDVRPFGPYPCAYNTLFFHQLFATFQQPWYTPKRICTRFSTTGSPDPW